MYKNKDEFSIYKLFKFPLDQILFSLHQNERLEYSLMTPELRTPALFVYLSNVSYVFSYAHAHITVLCYFHKYLQNYLFFLTATPALADWPAFTPLFPPNPLPFASLVPIVRVFLCFLLLKVILQLLSVMV